MHVVKQKENKDDAYTGGHQLFKRHVVSTR